MRVTHFQLTRACSERVFWGDAQASVPALASRCDRVQLGQRLEPGQRWHLRKFELPRREWQLARHKALRALTGRSNLGCHGDELRAHVRGSVQRVYGQRHGRWQDHAEWPADLLGHSDRAERVAGVYSGDLRCSARALSTLRAQEGFCRFTARSCAQPFTHAGSSMREGRCVSLARKVSMLSSECSRALAARLGQLGCSTRVSVRNRTSLRAGSQTGRDE